MNLETFGSASLIQLEGELNVVCIEKQITGKHNPEKKISKLKL